MSRLICLPQEELPPIYKYIISQEAAVLDIVSAWRFSFLKNWGDSAALRHRIDSLSVFVNGSGEKSDYSDIGEDKC